MKSPHCIVRLAKIVLVKIVVGCYAIGLLAACSHNPTTLTQNIQSEKTNTPNSPVNFDPQPTAKLLTAQQISYTTINDFVWLPTGQGIVLITNSELSLFGLSASKTLEPVSRVQVDIPTLPVISQSMAIMAWAGKDNFVHLWDIDRQAILPSLGEGSAPITGISFSSAKNLLAWASYDQTISVWDVDVQQQIITWDSASWLSELAFSPDSKLVAGANITNFSLDIFDVGTGKAVQSIKWGDSASGVLYSAMISPDWNKAAWVSRGIVQVMDLSHQTYGPLLAHEDYVSAVAWAPNSLILATASGATADGQFSPVVQLWDIQTGNLLSTLVQQTGVIEINFSPDGRKLAVLLSGGFLRIWAIE